MPDSGILGKAMFVISRAQKLAGLPQIVPFFSCERGVPTLQNVVIHGDDIERCCIGGGVRIGVAFEPVHEVRSLRNFVRNFAVFALVFGNERERRARAGKISGSIEREGSPKGIAPEEPSKSRTLAFTRSAVSRHKSRSQVRIAYGSLEHAYARPIVSLLDLCIRKLHVHGLSQIISVIFR